MENILSVFKSKEVLKKILFTLLAFLVYKAATLITLPLINPQSIQAFFAANSGGVLGIANAFTGNALKNYSIIALGISPYITSSIVVQLLQMDIIPVLKEWTEEGETGKQKIDRSLIYKLGLAGFSFGNVMLLSFPEYFQVDGFWIDQYKHVFRWLIFAFSIPVVFYSAQDYFISAYKGLKHKKHNKIVKDYNKQKSKHLDRLATKILKNDEKATQLKSKTIKGNFLDNF